MSDAITRNDPIYRAKRKLAFVKEFYTGTTHIQIARLDVDVYEVSKQYDIPVVIGGPEPPMDNGPVFWCVFGDVQDEQGKYRRVCANIVCAVAELRFKKFQCCGTCNNAYYCSTTCQRIHWKYHKQYCININKIEID